MVPGELKTEPMNSEDQRVALDAASWPVLLIDSKGKILRSNKAASELFGANVAGGESNLNGYWDPASGQSCDSFLAAEAGNGSALRPMNLMIAGQKTLRLASICRADQAGTLMVQVFPDPQRPLGEAASTLAEAQAHKQKLDCALQLARTVSHEFNNALTSVLGHTSYILATMDSDHRFRSNLLEVEKSAARAAEISNDLASFSRQEKDAQAETGGSINPVLQRCVEFFKKGTDATSVTWKLQLERSLFAVKFDELKMQQAFLRVIENSVQAFRGGQGRITVSTRNVELRQATQDRNVKLNAGTYVCVEISDDAGGIEADVLPRIFEPFFTTKRDKKHRGLGLAWVYGIVTNLRGGVAVSSKPGEGTSVRIYLPAEARILSEAPQFTREELRGTQSILFVDDEELVLTMGKAILSEHGYQVETANGGKQALSLISARKEPYHLVITDLLMPAMSGRELVDKIQELAPGTRIICTSGYPWPSPQVKNLAFLKKPFTAQELLSSIKLALRDEESH